MDCRVHSSCVLMTDGMQISLKMNSNIFDENRFERLHKYLQLLVGALTLSASMMPRNDSLPLNVFGAYLPVSQSPCSHVTHDCKDDWCAAEENQAAYNRLGHLQCELQHMCRQSLALLFEAKWKEVKGYDFMEGCEYSDNEGCNPNLQILEHELRYSVPDMQYPVAQWDMGALCTALNAKSLKCVMYNALVPTTKKPFLKSVMCFNVGHCHFGARCMYSHSEEEMLRSRQYNSYKTKMCLKHPNCAQGENCTFAHSAEELRGNETVDEKMYLHFSSLVRCGLVTENELRSRYLQSFSTCSWNVSEAVQCLRFVRNILCHMKGGPNQVGLCEEVSNTLWEVVNQARECVELSTKHSIRRHKSGKMSVCCVSRETQPSNTNPSYVTLQNAYARHDECQVMLWEQCDVLNFFERCKFPTQGIKESMLDGPGLVDLWNDADAESLFTSPYPHGLGLNKLMFKGRLNCEMRLLAV